MPFYRHDFLHFYLITVQPDFVLTYKHEYLHWGGDILYLLPYKLNTHSFIQDFVLMPNNLVKKIIKRKFVKEPMKDKNNSLNENISIFLKFFALNLAESG